jgi:glycogen debranching enzyme
MPIDIKVAPPGIVIGQGRTFMVTDDRGEINGDTNQGVYAVDTRFISFYRITMNRQPLISVDASQLSFYASRIYLTNPQIFVQEGVQIEKPIMGALGGVLHPHSISLIITRQIGESVHEDWELANYSGTNVKFLLELELRSDFADLFEVKAGALTHRGREHTVWLKQKKALQTTYDRADFHRSVIYQISNNDTPIGYANGQIFFEIELASGETWHTGATILLEHGQHIKQPAYMYRGEKRFLNAWPGARSEQNEELRGGVDERQRHWQTHCTRLLTPTYDVYRTYLQSVEDMGALRIYDLDVSADAWVPAAGIPWFVTLFGRDSLIVSLQNMMVSAGFARGALKRLAEHQAKERDDWRDAQPGKILHEMRFGELAHFGEVPFTPYYGTADATILYLIVLSETYRWTGDIDLLKEYRPVAEACLDWIDHYGDLDGDGFQEYKTYSSLGYENIAWKDASNAVVYADGTQVQQPKGLCELQGYVYDARIRMVEVFQALGDEKRAQVLLQQAQQLKHNFQHAFWMEDEGCFAFGLDPQKKQITSVASNTGQCLWSGIVDQDKAERVMKRLLQEDMWSGWGVRTLSSKNPAYNPLAYQLGSIWPHDNGIIAAGFKRYGFAKEANQIARALFDAAERFESYRLPEVFAGTRRQGLTISFPQLYPGGANVPQAWASGSIFHLIQTILGLRADTPHQRLYVNPTLPDWLPEVDLQQLRVGPCLINLHFWREGDRSCWEVRTIQADPNTPHSKIIQVMHEPDTIP